MTRLGRTTFAYYLEFFPKAQTLVFQHLHKAVETPIIIHHPIADVPLAPFFAGLTLLLLDDHLPLGKEEISANSGNRPFLARRNRSSSGFCLQRLVHLHSLVRNFSLFSNSIFIKGCYSDGHGAFLIISWSGMFPHVYTE
jgi:hypothetical protein